MSPIVLILIFAIIGIAIGCIIMHIYYDKKYPDLIVDHELLCHQQAYGNGRKDLLYELKRHYEAAKTNDEFTTLIYNCYIKEKEEK